jgi:H+/Cl- antiporter ClcA
MSELEIAWGCLAFAVIALAMFRNLASLREDDSQFATTEQPAWGKSLAMFVVATGLLLCAIYLYRTLKPH